MPRSNTSAHTRRAGRPIATRRGRRRCSCKLHAGPRWLALAEFSFNEARGSYSSWCRACQREYNKQYYRRKKKCQAKRRSEGKSSRT